MKKITFKRIKGQENKTYAGDIAYKKIKWVEDLAEAAKHLEI